MVKKSYKTKSSVITFIKTHWVIITFFIASFMVSLFFYNSHNPFALEESIKNKQIVKTLPYDNYIITVSVLESRFGSTLPDTRNREYFIEYSINAQKEIGDGAAYLKSTLMFRPIINLFYPLIDTESKKLNQKLVIISNNSILISKIFDKEASVNLLDLIERGTIRQGSINILLIKRDRIYLRILVIKTDNEYNKEEIMSQSAISETDNDKIYSLLVSMADN